jgi:hypothetical protein
VFRLASMIWDYGHFTPDYDDRTDDEDYINSGRMTGYKAEIVLGVRGSASLRSPMWHVERAQPSRLGYQEHFKFPDDQRFSSFEEQRTICHNGYRQVDISGFHFDTGWKYFAAWANNGPTEILLPSGEIFIVPAEKALTPRPAGFIGTES